MMTRHVDESVDEHDDKTCAEEDVGPSAAESRDDGLARPTEDEPPKILSEKYVPDKLNLCSLLESCADESISEVPDSPNE